MSARISVSRWRWGEARKGEAAPAGRPQDQHSSALRAEAPAGRSLSADEETVVQEAGCLLKATRQAGPGTQWPHPSPCTFLHLGHKPDGLRPQATRATPPLWCHPQALPVVLGKVKGAWAPPETSSALPHTSYKESGCPAFPGMSSPSASQTRQSQRRSNDP